MNISLKTMAVAGLLSVAFSSQTLAGMVQPMGDIVPFTEDNWALIAGAAFEKHDGQDAVKLAIPAEGAPYGFGAAALKAAPLANGIVEYDLWFEEGITFGGIQFHAQDQGNYENFYMRAHLSGKPDSNQYFGKSNGVDAWQLYYGERWAAATEYAHGEWMHVRMVISDGLADIYIRDMETPVNTIALMRDDTSGGLVLWGLNITGPVWFSNFAVKRMDTAEIKGTPTPKAAGTPGTVTTWEVSNPFDSTSLDGKTRLAAADMAGLEFSSVQAEPRGMVNLGKLSGVSKGADAVFARLNITADTDQIKEFEFGFSDIGTVFLNGEILFKGADNYRSRDYRFLGTVGYYDKVYLNLKKGENELLIAVSEDFVDQTGWAVQGRFTDMNGISLK